MAAGSHCRVHPSPTSHLPPPTCHLPPLLMHRVEKNRSGLSRSRPVSCDFCRSRKLRCSRQFPCVNCTSRGLTCQLNESVRTRTENVTTSAPGVTSANDVQPSAFENEVMTRLRRLEYIVIEQGQDESPATASTGSSMQMGSPPVQVQPSSRKLDADSSVERSPASDVDWLEGNITHPGSTVRSADKNDIMDISDTLC